MLITFTDSTKELYINACALQHYYVPAWSVGYAIKSSIYIAALCFTYSVTVTLVRSLMCYRGVKCNTSPGQCY